VRGSGSPSGEGVGGIGGVKWTLPRKGSFGLGGLASATAAATGNAGRLLGQAVAAAGAVAGSFTSAANAAVGRASQLASATASGTTAMVGGLASALGYGPGSGAGEPAADIALGLVNGLLEIMASDPMTMDAESPQAELAGHIDAIISCRSLNDFGARLLDYWYALRPDALAQWPLHKQQSWVQMAYLVKYGDLRRAPGPLARACCGLVLELGDGFRGEPQSDTAVSALRYCADLAQSTPPPAGWGFPAVMIAARADSSIGAQRYCAIRADTKGFARVAATELIGIVSKQGGKFVPPDPPQGLDGGRGSPEEFRAIAGSFDYLAGEAGDAALSQKCLEKSDRLFTQKTRPIHFQNQASVPLKICLFSEDDRLCVVPVGGVGGSCVVILDPSLRAQLRPPGHASRFQLKVLQPGLIEKRLYMAFVERGASVQLRSRDCTCENR